MGRKLVRSLLSFDFCTGVTTARFQESGKVQVEML